MRHPEARTHRNELRICTFGIISPHPDDFVPEVVEEVIEVQRVVEETKYVPEEGSFEAAQLLFDS